MKQNYRIIQKKPKELNLCKDITTNRKIINSSEIRENVYLKIKKKSQI